MNGNWAYSYDSFNRLSTAVATGKGLGCGWVYDRYGNRWQQNPYTGTCGQDQRTYTMNGANTNNNRMDGASYDALGNLLINPSDGGHYMYDAESRLVQAVNGAVTTKYLYDAEGRRVAKLSGATVTNEYLFDTDGSQQIELNGSGAVLHTNLYAGGKLIATYNGTNTYFHFTDWLGTRRYEANSAGAQTEICTNLPFGDSQSCTGTPDATEHHFTGKEHDTESNLDYFGARYYASSVGRFVSADLKLLALRHLLNPQKINRYAYVLNNPLALIDPDGQEEIEVQLRAFIPQKSVSDPLGRTFAGDNRGFTSSQNVTSRTSITVRIETDASVRPGNPIISVTQSGTAGQTKMLDKNGNVVQSATQTQGLPTVTGSRDANGNPVLNFQENAKNPLEPQSITPGIRADLNVAVTQNGTSVDASGTLSATPSFELNVGSTNVPLQSAPESTIGFGLGLFENNTVQVAAPLVPAPAPPPQESSK